MPETNVVVVSFPEESGAYQALSELNELDRGERVRILSAAIVERDTAGHLSFHDGRDPRSGEHILGGGLAGMLIGVLGGPLGMLLGFSTGAFIGGVVDLDRASETDEIMSDLARAIPPGRTVLVAELEEYAVVVVDDAMERIGGTVLRRPAGDVRAGVKAAEEAGEAADERERDRSLGHS